MSAKETTRILAPTQIAWEVAMLFGRMLPSIVIVKKGWEMVHTELVRIDPHRLHGVG